ncbi:MAG: hypothetical protein HWD61_04695 [Parachlamydiaceae bacterium]|nr:MAG: hypothetical protein HWD61_04695 [Parachlamydiaceae bacterium]
MEIRSTGSYIINDFNTLRLFEVEVKEGDFGKIFVIKRIKLSENDITIEKSDRSKNNWMKGEFGERQGVAAKGPLNTQGRD